MNILGAHVAIDSARRDGSNGVLVSNENTLGVSGGARGIVDSANVIGARGSGSSSRSRADFLDLGHGVNLDTVLRGNVVQDGSFGVRSQFAMVKGIK